MYVCWCRKQQQVFNVNVTCGQQLYFEIMALRLKNLECVIQNYFENGIDLKVGSLLELIITCISYKFGETHRKKYGRINI